MSDYQLNYASGRPHMYDVKARERRAIRIVKSLQEYFGKEEIKKLALLDIGSSTGIIDNKLSFNFKSVTGADIDEGAVKFAKEKFKKKNLKFKVEDAMKLTFPENS